MIEFAEVTIGSGGVAPCASCPADERAPRPVLEVAEAVARAAGRDPAPDGVSFVGFEPFAHPELPAIIEAAAAVGLDRIRLRTDAGALSQPGNARGVFGAGVRQLEVVVLGGREDHDRLTGRPGLFDAASTGVAAFTAAAEAACEPFAVTGLVPVCRHTPPTAIADAVAALAAMGACAVRIDLAENAAPVPTALAAALDTATVAAVHAFVTGAVPQSVPATYARAPWSTLAEKDRR